MEKDGMKEVLKKKKKGKKPERKKKDYIKPAASSLPQDCVIHLSIQVGP